MSMCVKVRSASSAAIASLCLGAFSAAALPVDERELGRWVPSLAVLMGVTAQQVEGHLASTDVYGPQFMPPFPPFPDPAIVPGTPATERTRMMTPYVGGSVEVMTPAWKSIPTRPRLYAHADVSFAFGPEYSIPVIGDPGPYSVAPGSSLITVGTVLGQGAKTQVEVDPLLIMAGAGFAFTFDAGGRALRLKPSVEYMRQEVQLSGLVRRLVRVVQNPPPNISGLRDITLSAQDTRIYHGLGPGLEVEIDTGRAGPFVLTLFADAKAWAFLDNSKFVLTDVNEWGEKAEWSYLTNKWAFGGAIGLRFRWVPE